VEAEVGLKCQMAVIIHRLKNKRIGVLLVAVIEVLHR
jgi:hypothetical protein